MKENRSMDNINSGMPERAKKRVIPHKNLLNTLRRN